MLLENRLGKIDERGLRKKNKVKKRVSKDRDEKFYSKRMYSELNGTNAKCKNGSWRGNTHVAQKYFANPRARRVNEQEKF